MLFFQLSLCHLSLRRSLNYCDTYTLMFDEKKEDKGVADYCQCPHNHQENEAGKKNLKITNTSFHLVSMQGVFVFRGHSIAKIKVAKALKNKNAFFLGHPVQYTHPLWNIGRHSVGILKRKVFVN